MTEKEEESLANFSAGLSLIVGTGISAEQAMANMLANMSGTKTLLPHDDGQTAQACYPELPEKVEAEE